MRIRKRWVIAGIVALFTGTLFYIFSSRRDLEVALGTDWLPWSLKNAQIRTDAWTDYSVRACFEIDPDDMRELLKKRPYVEERRFPPQFGGNFVHQPSWDFFPEVAPFEVTRVFGLETVEPIFTSRIWVNHDYSRAYVHYAVD